MRVAPKIYELVSISDKRRCVENVYLNVATIRWMDGNTFQLWGMIINFAHGGKKEEGRILEYCIPKDATVFKKIFEFKKE